MNKKGLEMEQLILIILGLFLLFAIFALITYWRNDLAEFLDRLLAWF